MKHSHVPRRHFISLKQSPNSDDDEYDRSETLSANKRPRLSFDSNNINDGNKTTLDTLCKEAYIDKTLVLIGLPPKSTKEYVSSIIGSNGHIVGEFTHDSVGKKSISVHFDSSKEAHDLYSLLLGDMGYIGAGFRIQASFEALPHTNVTKLPVKYESVHGSELTLSQKIEASRFGPLEIEANHVFVRFPNNYRTLGRINKIIRRIAKASEGKEEAELRIKRRERANEKYNFLFDETLAEHVYYKWRLYSILNNQDWDEYSLAPVKIDNNEPMTIWHPPRPPKDELDATTYEDSGQTESRYLSKLGRLRLNWLIDKVSKRRGSILRVTSFAMEHSGAGDEIIGYICDAIVGASKESIVTTSDHLDGPEVNKCGDKVVPWLWVLSDILHNASLVNHAWQYRKYIETELPRVFSTLGKVYEALGGRVRAENLYRQICAVVDVWDVWSVYPSSMINTWKHFVKPQEQSSACKHALDKPTAQVFKPGCGSNAVDDDIDGEPFDFVFSSSESEDSGNNYNGGSDGDKGGSDGDEAQKVIPIPAVVWRRPRAADYFT